MLKSRSGGVGASAPFEVDGLHFGPLVRNDNNFNISNRQLVNADYRRDDAFEMILVAYILGFDFYENLQKSLLSTLFI